MDSVFDSLPTMYRAELTPDLYDEKPMLVDRWSEEDRQMFVGGQGVYPPRLEIVK